MATFVLASANEHKAREMRLVLRGAGIELLDRPTDVGDIDETGTTLEDNALIKARAIARATNMASMADDTGLFVRALNGRPGVHSARFAGATATSQENVDELLRVMRDVDEPERDAYFRTVIAVAYPSGESWHCDGVLEGFILRAPVGSHGFGYDAVFAPVGWAGITLAQVSEDEKNAISHRAKALASVARRFASD